MDNSRPSKCQQSVKATGDGNDEQIIEKHRAQTPIEWLDPGFCKKIWTISQRCVLKFLSPNVFKCNLSCFIRFRLSLSLKLSVTYIFWLSLSNKMQIWIDFWYCSFTATACAVCNKINLLSPPVLAVLVEVLVTGLVEPTARVCILSLNYLTGTADSKIGSLCTNCVSLPNH